MYSVKLAFGNDRYTQVCTWKGSLRVDLHEWDDDKPTKKGISLTLNRWKNFDAVDESLSKRERFQTHLGGNEH